MDVKNSDPTWWKADPRAFGFSKDITGKYGPVEKSVMSWGRHALALPRT